MTSHMKKKTKRFQDGGSAEDKRRGLEASKSDKVGFFERLRMGNIDDPKSEAYKRFGAGRGQAETAKERETIKASKSPVNPFQGDDVDPFSAARAPSGEIKQEPAKAPAKTPSKAPIVTKEQLKASGFDNLRDYLNAQRGLTRRGESAPRKPVAAAPRGSYRGTKDEGDAGEEAARKAQEAKVAKAREMRKQTDPGLMPSQAKSQREAEMKRDAAKTGSQRLAEKANRAGNIYQRSRDAQKKKDEERKIEARRRMKARNMASGGAVSSASKRADGIAVRGKTRCKVC
ncbi:MAG: hypothetical protein ACO3SN_07650 [Burkholderiaceae bacterium]